MLKEYIDLIASLIVLISAAIPCVISIGKMSNGQKCLLRSQMLSIYYRHLSNGEIRQYEYENFVYLYEAYKSLKGNSFIDKIYDEVKEWKIIS